MSQQLVMPLSHVASAMPESLSVYMNALAQALAARGEGVRVLSRGEALFEHAPLAFDPRDVARGYHYSDSRGILELREVICRHYLEAFGAEVRPDDQVIVSCGSKPLVYMALRAVLNDGDEVLVHEPAWLSYPEAARLAGGVPRLIPWHVGVEGFVAYLTRRTRAVVICNPNNPAGRTYTRADLECLYGLCRPRGIWLVADEAYADFVGPGEFCSMASVAAGLDGVIVVNSLSKSLGVSGWRLGYLMAPADVAYAVLKLNQHLLTCAPTLLSLHVARNFDSMLAEAIPQARAVVTRRAEVARAMQGMGLGHMGGSATFYLFADVGAYPRSSLDLALHLLARHGISVVPGCAYGESTDSFIRVGVGTEDAGTVVRCLETVRGVVEAGEYDGGAVEDMLRSVGVPRPQEVGGRYG